ncbi:MAG: methionyl-tRNA formyltransferase [Pseudomonadota bacterium]
MLTIVFMGTPEFAVPALQALHDHPFRILQVVTQPDRAKGRGRLPVAPPVKEKALALGYPVMQPVSLKADEVHHQLASLQPDFFVVVAYGHILSGPLLALPRKGAINVHASLLPKYRGPAPIHRAIIAGETETGVTTMRMDTGLDTGDMLLSEKLVIEPDDTAQSLHDRLAPLGAALLIRTLEGLAAGNIAPVAQDHPNATYAPLLKKAEGRMNWHLPALALERFIRGMTPWPGAFTFYGNKRLKIYKAAALPDTAFAAPGAVVRGFPDELRVATGGGILSILELQGESGKRMAVKDFLRGFKIDPGGIFG